MNRFIGTVTFSLLGVLATLTSFAHEPSKHASPVKQVEIVLQRNAEGFERGDLTMVETLWAHDETVTVFESGHANYGWTDYRDHHLKPELEEMKNVTYRLSEIKPRVEGSIAWATFKYTIAADLKERHVEGGGVGTAVLQKREGEWKIVHWHTSAPRRPPGATVTTSTPPKQ